MYKTTFQAIVITFLSCSALLFFVPAVSYIILSICLIATTWIGYQRYRLTRSSGELDKEVAKDVGIDPFVSIHIAVCREPVNSVIKTIKAASRQSYNSFEVIVLYNNTSDKKLWLPIKLICEFLPNVRFYNYENIQGYKAGALNICRKHMDERTELIFTLDADYILEPLAIEKAVEQMDGSAVDLLQFPQAYNNHGDQNGLAQELQHYFKMYAINAGKLNKNLPTGTLTLVKTGCLDKIGGWPTNSITEDAYLGIELLSNNCKIGYCDEVIGTGTMPCSTTDLKTQRMRWIFGNFQTLIHALRAPQLPSRTKSVLVTQLTSWLNFNGLAWMHILLVALLSPLYKFPYLEGVVVLSLVVIATNAVFQILSLIRCMETIKSAVSAYLISVANSVEGAYAWWGYFLNADRPFARTSKFVKGIGLDLEQIVFNTVLALTGVLLYLNLNSILGSLVMASAGLRILSRVYLYHNLQDARTRLNKPQTL